MVLRRVLPVRQVNHVHLLQQIIQQHVLKDITVLVEQDQLLAPKEHILLLLAHHLNQHAYHVMQEDMVLQPRLQLPHALQHVLLDIRAPPAQLTHTEELLQVALDLALAYVLLDTSAMVLQKQNAWLEGIPLLGKYHVVHVVWERILLRVPHHAHRVPLGHSLM